MSRKYYDDATSDAFDVFLFSVSSSYGDIIDSEDEVKLLSGTEDCVAAWSVRSEIWELVEGHNLSTNENRSLDCDRVWCCYTTQIAP